MFQDQVCVLNSIYLGKLSEKYHELATVVNLGNLLFTRNWVKHLWSADDMIMKKMCMSQKITVEKSFHNISKNLMNSFDDIQMDILH